jgi:predicted dehydrogenase
VKILRTAVIGVGRLGAEHARIYSAMERAELVGAADVDPVRGKEIAGRYDTHHFFDYRMLEGKVDAVSIAVPTSAHYEAASFFLERGVHVLLEKPVTETLEEADRLIELGESGGVVFQVGHIERFNSALSRAGRDIENPRFIECHRLSPYQPRGTDVSVVLDLMIHDIDIILDMVKSDILKIDALGVSVLSDAPDIANARIEFRNGAVANITSSRVSRERLRKIRVFAPNRYVSINYLDQSAVVCRKEEGGIAVENVSVEKEEPLKLEIEHFIDCVLNKKPPLVSGISAREALGIALQISEIIGKR